MLGATLILKKPPAKDNHTHPERYQRKVYLLPKSLDEEVARLHLDQLGVKLTRLSEHDARAAPPWGLFRA